jgi:Helix-turn-helix domain
LIHEPKKAGIVAMAGRWRDMKSRSSQPHMLNAAQRGVVVQRVIVDGWTLAAAAEAAGLPECLVAAWVADFRRHGMASLRRRPRKTAAAEYFHRRLLRPVWLSYRAITFGVRRLFTFGRPAMPSPIRQSRDDRLGGS